MRLGRKVPVSTICQNRECGRPFAVAGRSRNDNRYCETCGELVWAFRPNRAQPRDWFHVDELRDGAEMWGDQCEGCGLSAYTLRQRSARLWVAVCEGQEWDGEVIDGCKMEHPVRQKMAMTVIF